MMLTRAGFLKAQLNASVNQSANKPRKKKQSKKDKKKRKANRKLKRTKVADAPQSFTTIATSTVSPIFSKVCSYCQLLQ